MNIKDEAEEADRKRAGQAAIQHDASATGIEAMMIEDRRAKAQEVT